MRVEDIMAKPVVTAQKGETLEAAAQKMLAHKIGCVVVVEADGTAAGILSQSDFVERAGLPYSQNHQVPTLLGRYVTEAGLERIYQDARSRRVHEAMRKPLFSVAEGDPIEKAADLMLRHDVKHVPVLRAGRPIGMVSAHDLLRAVQRGKAAAA